MDIKKFFELSVQVSAFAITTTMVVVWFIALSYSNGLITLDVNSIGEGIIELISLIVTSIMLGFRIINDTKLMIKKA